VLNINLLLTSRTTLTLEHDLKITSKIEISAHDEDLQKYVLARIPKEPQLRLLINEDPQLKDTIARTILERAKAM